MPSEPTVRVAKHYCKLCDKGFSRSADFSRHLRNTIVHKNSASLCHSKEYSKQTSNVCVTPETTTHCIHDIRMFNGEPHWPGHSVGTSYSWPTSWDSFKFSRDLSFPASITSPSPSPLDAQELDEIAQQVLTYYVELGPDSVSPFLSSSTANGLQHFDDGHVHSSTSPFNNELLKYLERQRQQYQQYIREQNHQHDGDQHDIHTLRRMMDDQCSADLLAARGAGEAIPSPDQQPQLEQQVEGSSNMVDDLARLTINAPH